MDKLHPLMVPAGPDLDPGCDTVGLSGWAPKAASPRHGWLIYIVLFPWWSDALWKASISPQSLILLLDFTFVVIS